jgi:hypothetical protein
MDAEVDALLAAVPKSFAPFDETEVEGLRLYHRLVGELDRRKLTAANVSVPIATHSFQSIAASMTLSVGPRSDALASCSGRVVRYIKN